MDSKSKQDSTDMVNSEELELIGYRLFADDRTLEVICSRFNPPATIEETIDRFVIYTGGKVLASYDKAWITIVEPIYKGFNERSKNTDMYTEQALSA